MARLKPIAMQKPITRLKPIASLKPIARLKQIAEEVSYRPNIVQTECPQTDYM